jgi:membrane dipeptidase
MGIVLLNALWNKDADPAIPVTLDNIVEVVDYVCQLTGSSAHVGIGTDWYAGTGASGVPDGLDSYADLGKVGEALRKQGYSENDVKAILSGNMLRILRQTLP